MPNKSPGTPRSLPEQPNLQHLKAQAKDLLKAGEAKSLTEITMEYRMMRTNGTLSRCQGFTCRMAARKEMLRRREIGIRIPQPSTAMSAPV